MSERRKAATPQISIDADLLDRFDAHIAVVGTTDRSKMIAHLIRQYLAAVEAKSLGDATKEPRDASG